jgi:diguanylate cyclase (GGDEF)-like protein
MRTRPTLRDALARVNARVTLFAACLMAVAMLVVGFLAARDYAQQQLRVSAQAAGYTVEAALVFDDRQAIAEAVQPFTENPETARIEVRGANGAALFEWRAGATDLHFWGEGQLRALAALSPSEWPVMHDGRQIGTVIITGSADGLAHLLARGLGWMAACLLVIGIAAWLLTRRLQRAVAEPLAAMAQAAHKMREDRAYYRRLPGAEIAEIDSLSEDFNALLAEIQTWHDAVASEHESLAWRAMHDALTGLANRASFEGQVARAVEDAAASGGTLGLLYLDANGFKQVNDAWGHAAGDALLIEIAARIRACADRDDPVARLGGDEFVVLLTGPGADARTVDLASSIRAAMAPDFALPGGSIVQPGLSIGAASFPIDATDAAGLIAAADAAMYAEKQRRAVGGTSAPAQE